MRKYCLSYDAKNANNWQPNQLKEKIIRVLIENGARALANPVATTILFEDSNRSRISSWNNIIFRELHNDLFYYLCKVAIDQENRNLDRDEGDSDLEGNFQTLLNSI